MIDYDKLKLIHELADKLNKPENIYDCMITTHYCSGRPVTEITCGLVIQKSPKESPTTQLFSTLDELIAKLQELTQPKPKYKIGQEVWFIFNNEPRCFTIYEINGSRYILNGGSLSLINEDKLYQSKEELIESQIWHWIGLRKEITDNL